jgi:hypothetical protein
VRVIYPAVVEAAAPVTTIPLDTVVAVVVEKLAITLSPFVTPVRAVARVVLVLKIAAVP